MESNFKEDINVEQEIGKFLDIYFYPCISSSFYRVKSKNFQKAGIDVDLENKGIRYLIDEKCAIYYANQNLKSFTFELSYKKREEIKRGWFLNSNLETTHYNLMWLNTINPNTKTKEITFDQIKEVEILTISKEKIKFYLNDIGLVSETLETLSKEQRQKNLRFKSIRNDIELILSKKYFEEPVNLKLGKILLEKLADYHYVVTSEKVINKKMDSLIMPVKLPHCNYSYVLQISSDLIKEKENVIRKMIKNGIKVFLFTDKEVTIFEDDILKSKLLQIFVNTDYLIRKETEVIDGKNEKFIQSIASNYLEFNIEQFLIEHVNIEENLAVKAGAGTGKTTVMVDRIIYLMIAENIEPSEIVLVTFTRNSAKVMYEKLKEALMKKYEVTGSIKFLHRAEKLNDMRIQTISSFSKGLLKELGQLSGLGLSFKLREFKTEKKKWLETILNELIKEYEMENKSIIQILKPLSFHEFIDVVHEFWKEFENNGLSIDEILASNFGITRYGEVTNKLIEDMIKRAVIRYKKELQKMNAVSLNDLTREIDGIKREFGSKVFQNLQKPIKFLFVDEFQDSDKSQIGLFTSIQEAFDAKIFVVGDTNQSIYRFRGAQHTAFEILEKQLSDRKIKLNGQYRLIKNYRSSKELLDSMQKYFKNWKDKSLLHKNYENLQGMTSSTLFLNEPPLEIRITNRKKEDLEKEIITVIKTRWNQIEELNKDAGDLKEIKKLAVITRTRAEARMIYDWCRKEGVPANLKGGGDFYTSEVVKDFNELLLFLMYPNEMKFFLPVLVGPYGGESIKVQSMVWDEGYNSEIEPLLQELGKELLEFIDQLRYKPIFSVLRSIIKDTQVMNQIYSRSYRKLKNENFDNKSDADIKKLAISEANQYKLNLGKLFEIMHQKFSEDFVTLLQLQNWLQLNMAMERKEHQENLEDTNRVEIITAHGAKGLEYYSVVIPFTQRIFENSFSKILLEQDNSEASIKVGWKIKKNTSVKYNSNFDEMERIENEETKQEEARLLYVAMTRAESELYIVKNEINDVYQYTWSKLLGM